MAKPEPDFFGFVGQPTIVRRFRRWVSGALQTAALLPHSILIGRAGCGKTMLAKTIAKAMGTNIVIIHAHRRLKRSDILTAIRSLRHGDILFIDEAHALDQDALEGLYYAIDEGLIPAAPSATSAATRDESVARFTLILATTDPGKIAKPLRTRLTEVFMDEYTQRNLREIARREAIKQGINISPQAARVLAVHSQGSPRQMRLWLENLRLTFPGVGQITNAHVERFLRGEGIDAYSLRPQQRSYLRLLVASVKHQLTINQLSAKLGLDLAYVREEIEHFLLDRRYLEVLSNNQRRITEAGIAIVLPNDEPQS